MWGPGIPSRMQVAAHPYFHCNFWRCLPCSPGGGRVLMTVLDSLRPLGSPLSLSCRPCPASWIRLNADAKIKAPSATYLPAVRPVRASVPAPVKTGEQRLPQALSTCRRRAWTPRPHIPAQPGSPRAPSSPGQAHAGTAVPGQTHVRAQVHTHAWVSPLHRASQHTVPCQLPLTCSCAEGSAQIPGGSPLL